MPATRACSVSGGERVDAGTASVDGDVLTIPLRTGLPDDGYLVTYRVISADSHPVAGAYSFVVGNGALVPAGGGRRPGPTPTPWCGAVLPIARWLGFAGLALAVGVPLLALLCWPGRLGVGAAAPDGDLGGRGASPSARLGSFLFQGPYAAAQRAWARCSTRRCCAPRSTSEAGQALLGPDRARARPRGRAAAGLAPRASARRPGCVVGVGGARPRGSC